MNMKGGREARQRRGHSEPMPIRNRQKVAWVLTHVNGRVRVLAWVKTHATFCEAMDMSFFFTRDTQRRHGPLLCSLA